MTIMLQQITTYKIRTEYWSTATWHKGQSVSFYEHPYFVNQKQDWYKWNFMSQEIWVVVFPVSLKDKIFIVPILLHVWHIFLKVNNGHISLLLTWGSKYGFQGMKSKVKKQNSDRMQETTVQDLKVTSSSLCWTYQWTGDWHAAVSQDWNCWSTFLLSQYLQTES